MARAWTRPSSIISSNGSSVETAARKHTFGTGMGLAITRGLLAADGGRVWGENAAGGGASFTIAVPARSRVVTGRGA